MTSCMEPRHADLLPPQRRLPLAVSDHRKPAILPENERCFFKETQNPIVRALPVDQKFEGQLAVLADFRTPFLFYEKQTVCGTRSASAHVHKIESSSARILETKNINSCQGTLGEKRSVRLGAG